MAIIISERMKTANMLLHRKLELVSIALIAASLTACSKSGTAYDKEYESEVAQSIVAHSLVLQTKGEVLSSNDVYSLDFLNLVETEYYTFEPEVQYLVSDDENHYVAVVFCKQVPKNEGWSINTMQYRVSFTETDKSISDVEVFDYAPILL